MFRVITNHKSHTPIAFLVISDKRLNTVFKLQEVSLFSSVKNMWLNLTMVPDFSVTKVYIML